MAPNKLHGNLAMLRSLLAKLAEIMASPFFYFVMPKPLPRVLHLGVALVPFEHVSFRMQTVLRIVFQYALASVCQWPSSKEFSMCKCCENEGQEAATYAIPN